MNIWHIPENEPYDDEMKYLSTTTNQNNDQLEKDDKSLFEKVVNQINDATPHYVLGYN